MTERVQEGDSGPLTASDGPAPRLSPEILSELGLLLDEVLGLLDVARAAEAAHASVIASVHPRHRDSAANLVQYVALRGRDIRDLQMRLASFGLSSMGRIEARVEANLEAVSIALALLCGRRDVPIQRRPDLTAGPRRLDANAASLLGPQPGHRVSRIMVTFPSEAATDAGLVARMMDAGMDVARINCAHDGPRAWAAMAANVRTAAGGGDCRISMDLAGPKLRTGPVAPGPEVLKVRPKRSATGVVVEPSRLALVPAAQGGVDVPEGLPRLPIDDADWLASLRTGGSVSLIDASGARRRLSVVHGRDGWVEAMTDKTVYFATGLRLRSHGHRSARIGTIPALPGAHLVRAGEQVVLTRSMEPGPVVTGGPHRIGCSLPQAFDDVRPGDRVWLDDGKIGGVVRTVTAEAMTVDVLTAGVNGVRLRAEKGINFPDSELSVRALTTDDLAALDHVVRHADMVNASFVRTAGDVIALLDAVRARGRQDLGIVLKIETVEAFENLPQILLAAMQTPDLGVMIARGDLAVEAGFERLAEVQEQILWICEAAHVPVIWATQVLDTMARTGLPSRAEVTDAAMADRAECVMLNKGPFIVEAIGFLAGILTRMQAHMSKKRTLLRRLRSWSLDAED
ncbi:pyruvate kinase [Sinomonas sp. P10A9]|uniref:pyruvate kinase n=1 Tax=Sinomonas puerhi TaxID=3238584 RepID=A0AB39L8V2_9MICC